MTMKQIRYSTAETDYTDEEKAELYRDSERMRKTIEKQMSEFLASGGEIKKIESGFRSDPPSKENCKGIPYGGDIFQ